MKLFTGVSLLTAPPHHHSTKLGRTLCSLTSPINPVPQRKLGDTVPKIK